MNLIDPERDFEEMEGKLHRLSAQLMDATVSDEVLRGKIRWFEARNERIRDGIAQFERHCIPNHLWVGQLMRSILLLGNSKANGFKVETDRSAGGWIT